MHIPKTGIFQNVSFCTVHEYSALFLGTRQLYLNHDDTQANIMSKFGIFFDNLFKRAALKKG